MKDPEQEISFWNWKNGISIEQGDDAILLPKEDVEKFIKILRKVLKIAQKLDDQKTS